MEGLLTTGEFRGPQTRMLASDEGRSEAHPWGHDRRSASSVPLTGGGSPTRGQRFPTYRGARMALY